jgi:hypothetical protein
MGLLDDLSNVESFGKAQSLFCGVCTLLGELPQAECDALVATMAKPKVSHTALSKLLKENGYNISDGVMGRHRRGVCSGVAK